MDILDRGGMKKKIISRYFFSSDSVFMSSSTVASADEYIIPPLANVKFSRIALKPGGQKSAQVC